MKLNAKERVLLKTHAQKLEPVVTIGKEGITPNVVTTADQALFAREIIKVSVLEPCPEPAAEAAENLAVKTKAQVVQVIGRKFVLYKKSAKKGIVPILS
ncbi:MAG: ribosome assembly RNA-binding protein YhbY [Firmicutes bacterium]|nr:ribosome assembly RNA-binding protein YhbY [Bacillota bacterium]